MINQKFEQYLSTFESQFEFEYKTYRIQKDHDSIELKSEEK